MTAYGFVIDHRKCIGCHACTVACKSENEVPVGDFRTWVKYVEKGTFPEVRRHFTVLRCNHCDEAPCVEICPVVALHKRPDAIVDLDRDACIGCRACMQACPYDALYLNEDTGTAEKCHYCAHRTELGLEPACVVVCPEQAIIAGDVSNPASKIARLIEEQPTSQRKVEKGTKPRVWYVDALEEALVPGSATEPKMFLWSDRSTPPPPVPTGFEPPKDLIASLDVGHPPAWGWHIWVYLLTKNIAAGAMMVAPLLSTLWASATQSAVGSVGPELVALVFLGVTGFLLGHDLGRPGRLLKIIFRPNAKSWLVKGTWVLMGFGALTTASLALRWFGATALSDWIRWLNLPLAAMSSAYTAFLFWQCRGRALWQEKGLFVHLLVQAALCGAGLAILLPTPATDRLANPSFVFVLLSVINALWLRVSATLPAHDAESAKAHAILKGTGAPAIAGVLFYLAAVLELAPTVISGFPSALSGPASVIAVLCAAAALLVYERGFVDAGQKVPNS